MTNPLTGTISAILALAFIVVVLYLGFAAGFNIMNWPDFILCEWLGADHRC